MSTRSFQQTVGVMLAFAGVLVAARAIAADEVFCAGYARDAVAQQNENLSQQCGLSGPRWHSSFSNHSRWCSGASTETARAEQAIRTRGLRECALAKTSPAQLLQDKKTRFCETYANVAVAAASGDVAACDLAGPQYSTDVAVHRNWCIEQVRGDTRTSTPGRTLVLEEQRQRLRRIVRCGTEYDACMTYARVAVAQYKASMALECGFSGPSWLGDQQGHHYWCVNVDHSDARNDLSETMGRDSALAQCSAF